MKITKCLLHVNKRNWLSLCLVSMVAISAGCESPEANPSSKNSKSLGVADSSSNEGFKGAEVVRALSHYKGTYELISCASEFDEPKKLLKKEENIKNHHLITSQMRTVAVSETSDTAILKVIVKPHRFYSHEKTVQEIRINKVDVVNKEIPSTQYKKSSAIVNSETKVTGGNRVSFVSKSTVNTGKGPFALIPIVNEFVITKNVYPDLKNLIIETEMKSLIDSENQKSKTKVTREKCIYSKTNF